MSDGETPSPVEIREITDRALRIQRFLLRRAWGVVYAALSISMFMTVFGTPIAARLGLPEFAIVSLIIVHGATSTSTTQRGRCGRGDGARDQLHGLCPIYGDKGNMDVSII